MPYKTTVFFPDKLGEINDEEILQLLDDVQTDSRIEQVVEEAKSIFEERYAETLDICEVARKLGVAYSYFRRAFKEHTGYSPWQYVINIRLATTCRLLLTTDAILEDIAYRVGFSSSFHLSSQFKKSYGRSPIHWKRHMRALSRKRKPESVFSFPMARSVMTGTDA